MFSDNDNVNSVWLTCEKCAKTSRPRHIRAHQGYCRACFGEEWTLEVEYSDAELTRIGRLINLLVRISFRVHIQTDEVNYDTYSVRNVDRLTALSLCQGLGGNRLMIKEFVNNHIGETTRRMMDDGGATKCLNCSILFVPQKQTTWGDEQCCSFVCLNEYDPEIAQEATDEICLGKDVNFNKKLGNIEVSCSCGQCFDVLDMFSGTYRKCPNCLTKILVQ